MKKISRLILILGLISTLVLGFLWLESEYRIELKKNLHFVIGQEIGADHPVAVYRSAGAVDGRTAGALYPLDCTNVTRLALSGFVTEKRRAGEQVSVIESGVVSGFSGLIPGRIYYANPATPGEITSTPPALPGQFSVPVGIAVSSTSLLTSAALGMSAPSGVPQEPGGNAPSSTPSASTAAAANLQQEILKDIIDERVNDCLRGRKAKCQFLVAISEAQGSPATVRATLDKNCETRVDTLDCFDSGRLMLPADESAGHSRFKAASDSCAAGRPKDCLIAAGILEARKNNAGQIQYYRQACARGVGIACADMGEKLSTGELVAAEKRCGQRSAADCIIAGGATHQKAPFEFACGLGDPLGCILFGYYFPRDPHELAQLEKRCKSNEAVSCLQLAGHRIGQTFDLVGGRSLLEAQCKKGIQAACNFMEYHAGS